MTPMPQPWAREVERLVYNGGGLEPSWNGDADRTKYVLESEHALLLAHTRELEAALKEAVQREERLTDENAYYKTRATFVCGLNKTYKAATGCGKEISGDEMYRCADCATPFCKRCIFTHFTEEDKRIRAALAASPSLWLGRAMSVVQESSDIDEAEQAIQKLLWERDYQGCAIDLQCELSEAVGIIEQYRAQEPRSHRDDLTAQADQFLERNKETK